MSVFNTVLTVASTWIALIFLLCVANYRLHQNLKRAPEMPAKVDRDAGLRLENLQAYQAKHTGEMF